MAPDIDLCLLGKIGNGKSALGNSLVQHDAFESVPNADSVTKEVSYAVAEFNGRKIKVVDGPGVGDTASEEGAEHSFPDVLASFISINPTGYHAFLLVVKFGGRFTREDKETFEYLKNIFGKDFVKRFCILVMTYGDQFEKQVSVSFLEWIDAQKGILAEIVKECNARVILFDNKTNDMTKKEKQIQNLIEMVDRLMFVNCRYTNEQFELARSVREAFILSSRKPFIAEEIMSQANIIFRNFKIAQEKIKTEQDTTFLEELANRAEMLYQEVVHTDNKLGVLKDLVIHVHSIRVSIMEEIHLCQRMAEYKELLRKESEEKLNQELKRQSDETRQQEEQKTAKLVAQLDFELQKMCLKNNQLEENYKSLFKKNNRDLFTAIKNKVIKTFRSKKNVKPESEIKNELDYSYLEY